MEEMISKISRRWMEIGILYGEELNPEILCPKCGKANLNVHDIMGEEKIERLMYCPDCGEKNYLLMKREECENLRR